MTAQRQERKGSRFGTIGFRPGIAFIGPWATRLLLSPLLTSLLLTRLLLTGVFLTSLFFTGLFLTGLFLTGLGALTFPQFVAQAATTERVIVNRYTGLAIEGFDPVAYFVDARPMIGLPEFEASQAGAVWRFRNAGNRASFAAHPDIYGPRFGGYDPIDLARGIAYAGNPRFWLISRQRLYLFGREESRDAFAADPERYLRDASARWPQIEQNLAR
jgi:hypothetical protein